MNNNIKLKKKKYYILCIYAYNIYIYDDNEHVMTIANIIIKLYSIENKIILKCISLKTELYVYNNDSYLINNNIV